MLPLIISNLTPQPQFRGNPFPPASVDPYISDSTPMATPTPGTRSKTKAVPVPVCSFHLDKTKHDTMNIKDNGKAVVEGSTRPINVGSLKKPKGSSFQPLLRTWSEVEGAEDELQTKPSTYALPNKKKRKCTSKGSFKKYVVPPQDSFEQQNAYFKEIDEYELIVEEVE